MNSKPIKEMLHANNRHRANYDFNSLIKTWPELGQFVKPNKFNTLSIDFFNPQAVKALNKALLMHYYNITYWEIPENYLCPPVPGRADYIHHIADFLNNKKSNKKIKCLDIGIGANCIYPIIGTQEYDWEFVGSDIDPIALEAANKIVQNNSILIGKIELRLQPNHEKIFDGIIQPTDHFDITICNPPFHASLQEAQKGTERKLRNLKQEKKLLTTLNFGGQNNELWCDGGEIKFIETMIHESSIYRNSSTWFTTLVSKESNLKKIHTLLNRIKAKNITTIPMNQGNKTSRVVVWTFQNHSGN